MLETIIWNLAIFGSALLFYRIGVYSERKETPMWFWANTEADASVITDVKKYNHENARMWKTYSLWYLAAGLAGFFSLTAALIILALSCTAGIAILILTYRKIFKKYSSH